jgi:hypothetical protein
MPHPGAQRRARCRFQRVSPRRPASATARASRTRRRPPARRGQQGRRDRLLGAAWLQAPPSKATVAGDPDGLHAGERFRVNALARFRGIAARQRRLLAPKSMRRGPAARTPPLRRVDASALSCRTLAQGWTSADCPPPFRQQSQPAPTTPVSAQSARYRPLRRAAHAHRARSCGRHAPAAHRPAFGDPDQGRPL